MNQYELKSRIEGALEGLNPTTELVDPFREDCIESNFKYSWGEALRLMEQRGSVWFFSINNSEIATQTPRVCSFGFDYAVACGEDGVKEIEQLISDYRKTEWDRDVMFKKLRTIEATISLYHHIVGVFS